MTLWVSSYIQLIFGIGLIFVSCFLYLVKKMSYDVFLTFTKIGCKSVIGSIVLYNAYRIAIYVLLYGSPCKYVVLEH